MRIGITTFLIALCLTTSLSLMAQADKADKKADSGFVFTLVKEVPVTSVKNQSSSGTCWSFSAIAFLESELLRMGKDTFDLSEMFCVRQAYSDKATMYMRFNGKHNFGGGGGFHDVTDVIKKYGIVPEEVYSGKVIGEENHIHGEMDEVLKANVDAVLKNSNRKLTPVWHQGFEGLLDAYLGKVPEKFTYKGTEYTPVTFSRMLGLNPDDYIEFTSFTHHPYYTSFILEIPDNWALGESYNLPLDEMMQVVDHALMNGYSVCWGSDVSEKGFSWRKGVAVVPDKNAAEVVGLERDKWEKMTAAEKEKELYKFEKPVPEKKITPELRQKEFDNFMTTDDHGMQIVGIYKDQLGNKYYKIKNSWGTDNPYHGYFYASEAFVRLKSTDLAVHKDAFPKEIRKKLGF